MEVQIAAVALLPQTMMSFGCAHLLDGRAGGCSESGRSRLQRGWPPHNGLRLNSEARSYGRKRRRHGIARQHPVRAGIVERSSACGP